MSCTPPDDDGGRYNSNKGSLYIPRSSITLYSKKLTKSYKVFVTNLHMLLERAVLENVRSGGTSPVSFCLSIAIIKCLFA